jgi:hypothetical protein
MMSRFLFNEALWDELENRIPRAKVVRAAVAYIGTGGSALLPLRRGDKLVVDMSLRSVRSGTTDPKEIKKFLREGVSVFSRGSLHAKFFVTDGVLIAGSSNISRHAKDTLDEAALLTDDQAAIARAARTFDQLCTEPVRKNYLDKCIAEYRPPKFGNGPTASRKRRSKVTQARLWIIAGLRYVHIPEDEEAAVSRVVKKAEKKLLDFERSEVDYTHYTAPVGFFKQIREGDWVITCVKDKKGFDVSSPSRFLGIEDYPRGKGKRRYLLLLEKSTSGKAIRWSTFQQAAPTSIAAVHRANPRTRPIANDADADALLRLWNARGVFRGKK